MKIDRSSQNWQEIGENWHKCKSHGNWSRTIPASGFLWTHGRAVLRSSV